MSVLFCFVFTPLSMNVDARSSSLNEILTWKNGGTDLFRHIRRASLPWISPSSPWRNNSGRHRRVPSSSTSSSSCSSFLNLSTNNHSDFESYNSPTLSFRSLKLIKRWNRSKLLSSSCFVLKKSQIILRGNSNRQNVQSTRMTHFIRSSRVLVTRSFATLKTNKSKLKTPCFCLIQPLVSI